MTTGLELIAKEAASVIIPEALSRVLKRRKDEATRIVIEELRIAKIDPDEVADRDDLVGMLITFYMAMAQGAAFRNLRVIAKVLANKAAYPDHKSDDFIMWSNAIAGLLHEEAVLLATLHRETEAAKSSSESTEDIFKIAISRTREHLIGPTKLIKSDDEFQALCGALTRTGFVILVSVWGGMSAALSPRLSRLAEMADLQEWADSDRNRP